MNDFRWLAKAVVQWALAKLPGGEALNYRLQRQSSEAFRAIRGSRILPLVEHIWRLNERRPIAGATIVELGTGWDLICSIIFSTLGAGRVVACDHVPHARIEAVQQVVEALTERLPAVVELTGLDEAAMADRLARMRACTNLTDFLAVAGIRYAAPSSLDHIPADDRSVDVVFTYAVLAHPPPAALQALARESRRVLAPGGVAYHYIGLQDPFVNLHRPPSNVRFLGHPEWLWKLLVSNSINSNNRLRGVQHLDIVRQAGGRILVAEGRIKRVDHDRLATLRVDRSFRSLTPEELALSQLTLMASFDEADDFDTRVITMHWRDQI